MMPAINPLVARLWRRLVNLEREINSLRTFYGETAAATTTAPQPAKPSPSTDSELLESF